MENQRETPEERFARERDELCCHYREAMRSGILVEGITGVGLVAGVMNLIEERGYFKYTDTERREIEGNPSFAEGVDRETTRRWKQVTVREVLGDYRGRFRKAV